MNAMKAVCWLLLLPTAPLCDSSEQACRIEAVASDDRFNETSARHGCVAVNGVKRPMSYGEYPDGMCIVEFNRANCTIINSVHFHKLATESNGIALADYINGLPLDTAIVGVTAYDICYDLSDRAVAALKTIGVDIGSRCGWMYKLAFVAVVGRSRLALMKIARPFEDDVKIDVSYPIAACRISAQSWSLDSGWPNRGHVIVNGATLLETAAAVSDGDKQPARTVSPALRRGIGIIQLNERCTLAGHRLFDTFHSHADSNSLADYINGLPVGTLIVGVTADEPCNSITDRALFALKEIGVDVSERCGWRVKFAFVSLIGQPAATVWKYAERKDDNAVISTIFPTFDTGVSKNDNDKAEISGLFVIPILIVLLAIVSIVALILLVRCCYLRQRRTAVPAVQPQRQVVASRGGDYEDMTSSFKPAVTSPVYTALTKPPAANGDDEEPSYLYLTPDRQSYVNM